MIKEEDEDEEKVNAGSNFKGHVKKSIFIYK